MAEASIEAAGIAYREGVGVTVVDPRWVRPLPRQLLSLAEKFADIVVVEDGLENLGVGSAVAQMLRSEGIQKEVTSIGVPQRFIEHSKRVEILADLRMNPGSIAQRLVALHSSKAVKDTLSSEINRLRD